MAKYTCKCGRPAESESGCFQHKKRKPLRKQSLRALSSKEDDDKNNKEETEKMWNLFLEIWKERPHYSEISGTFIWGEPLSIYFDHLLEKEKYPELKYDKRNIIIVTWAEHDQKHQGYLPFPKHQELIDRARKELL